MVDVCFFFFSSRRRHTRCGRDWSSDVCSSDLAADQNEAKLTVRGVPDHPGVAARLFGPVAAAGIVVDMIIQNASADGTTDMTFTVPRADYEQALELVRAIARHIGARDVLGD